MPKIILTNEILEKVKTLFDKNFGANMISEELHISNKAVYKAYDILLLKRLPNGIAPKIVPTEEQIQRVVELRNDNCNRQKIADITGYSSYIIKQIYKIAPLQKPSNEKICAECGLPKLFDSFPKRIKRRKIFCRSRCYECLNNMADEKCNKKKLARTKAIIEYEKSVENEIIELYNKTFNVKLIACAVKIKAGRIREILKSFGFDVSKNKRRKPTQTHKMCCKCPEKGLQPIENFSSEKKKMVKYIISIFVRFVRECQIMNDN